MPRPVINRKIITLDAAGVPVGRLATKIATILIGKHKATYFPNIDAGDFVSVLNIKGMKFTGAKSENKEYYHYSGWPGGMKTRLAKNIMPQKPEWIIRQAVDRMLPKNTHRARRIKRLTFVK
jgi:large subunit ribosomal protein L13